MKVALLLLSLVVSASAIPRTRAQDVTWSDIEQFIASEAVGGDPNTEVGLWFESVTGQKTWELTAATQNARSERGQPFDGWGLGWPKSGEVIIFPTPGQAEQLGEMIDEFRETCVDELPGTIPPSS